MIGCRLYNRLGRMRRATYNRTAACSVGVKRPVRQPYRLRLVFNVLSGREAVCVDGGWFSDCSGVLVGALDAPTYVHCKPNRIDCGGWLASRGVCPHETEERKVAGLMVYRVGGK